LEIVRERKLSITVNNSSLQENSAIHRCGCIPDDQLSSGNDLQRNSLFAAKAMASARWLRARLAESAITAACRCLNLIAAQAKNAESTPPE